MDASRIETLRADIALLQSSLLENELHFVSGSRDFWTSDEQSDVEEAKLPVIDVECSASPKILLRARYDADGSLEASILEPDHDIERADQGRLNDFCAGCLQTIKQTEDPTPLFNLFLWLREYVLDNPIESVSAKRMSLEQNTPVEAAPLPIMQLKRILIWTHHLLAVSKRKDIVAWSSELQLWGISKPGYPGVIVVEGLLEDADEFLARIKRLQWQALQVRCEEIQDLDIPDNMTLIAERQAAARAQAKLRVEGEKPHAIEVESLAEVSESLTNAGLADMFSSAMKLHK